MIIPITHGDANLYAMWVRNGYRIIPAEIDVPPSTKFFFGPEHVHSFRLHTRLAIDQHAAFRPDRQRWERVVRLHFKSYFREELEGRPIYASQRAAEDGVLEGAVETKKRMWWVDCKTPPSEPAARQFAYQIWEATCNWVLRVAAHLDDELPSLPAGNLLVNLDLTCLSVFDDWSRDGILALAEIKEIPTAISDHSISIPIELIRLFAIPANNAERWIVNTIVCGCLKLANAEDRDVDAVLTPLNISDDERYVHLMSSQEPRDIFAQSDDFA